MITILSLVIWIYILKKIWSNSFMDWGENLGFSVLSLMLMIMVTASILVASSSWKVETYRDEYSTQIYSLKNVNDIEGTFFLGSGYIDNQEYYYMFQKYEDGGLRRIKLLSRDSILYQGSSSPHIRWQVIHYRLPYWASIWPNFEGTDDSMYDIYIPSNSVVMKFNVN